MKRKLIVVILIVLLVPAIIYFAFPEVLLNLATTIEIKSAGLTEKSIKVGNHNIVYLEGGKGETILLLHGFGGDKSHWVRFAKSLTPTFQVVIIDLPGFGESSKIESESYTIANQVERLDRIVNALGLNKFHLAGNSMGGAIAGKYTVDFPDKVLSLGFFNTGGLNTCPDKSELTKLLENGENPLLVETPEDFDALLKFSFVKPPPIPKPIKIYLTEQAILSKSFNEKVFKDFEQDTYSLEPDLAKIEVKTLILWGDTDRLIHVSCTKILEQGLPNHKMVIMKNCGHCPMIERPEEAATHYLGFLKSS